MRSSLEVFDIASGRARVILQTDRLIEAPNWDPRGGALLVNGDGRLFRVALAAPALTPVDTDFADACNNDHGFSPDGRRIALSHATAAGSTIFTVPATGGSPVPVTDTNPSYWHGWSPDGGELAYCGKRAGAFDIHTIAPSGGGERRLTRDMGHCDGPDYSPDGAWIWFNSDVSGHAQLWRMRRDGSAAQRMTQDRRVNWFPHPAPLGGRVVYLSYPPGTVGHPADRAVELRVMPLEGGTGRRLLLFNGGQGTLNVPCWSPDGRSFAFVRYAEGSRG
ncbi:MAG: hypothetical protein AAGE76_13295 [Pseudomonadota bacterium]